MSELREHPWFGFGAGGGLLAAAPFLEQVASSEVQSRTPQPALGSNLWFNISAVMFVVGLVLLVLTGVAWFTRDKEKTEPATHPTVRAAAQLALELNNFLEAKFALPPLPLVRGLGFLNPSDDLEEWGKQRQDEVLQEYRSTFDQRVVEVYEALRTHLGYTNTLVEDRYKNVRKQADIETIARGLAQMSGTQLPERHHGYSN
jgi:hypothetical protein